MPGEAEMVEDMLDQPEKESRRVFNNQDMNYLALLDCIHHGSHRSHLRLHRYKCWVMCELYNDSSVFECGILASLGSAWTWVPSTHPSSCISASMKDACSGLDYFRVVKCENLLL